MRATLMTILCACRLMVSQLYAQADSSDVTFTYIVLSGSEVTVEGSTNINVFTCSTRETVSNTQAQLICPPPHDVAKFKDAVVKIRIESLNCGNDVMNENLFSSMHSDTYPYIIIELMEVRAINGKAIDISGNPRLSAKMNITMAGQKKLNVIQVEATNTGDGTFHFSGKHSLSLSAYGIQPPKALFGLIKVHDVITVHFDLKVKVADAAVQ